jgi:hypothetical protein
VVAACLCVRRQAQAAARPRRSLPAAAPPPLLRPFLHPGAGSYAWAAKRGDTALFLFSELFVNGNQAYFMTLFFFLSGLYVPGSYRRKGAAKFLLDRTLRLVVPCIVYSFLGPPFILWWNALARNPGAPPGPLLAAQFRAWLTPTGWPTTYILPTGPVRAAELLHCRARFLLSVGVRRRRRARGRPARSCLAGACSLAARPTTLTPCCPAAVRARAAPAQAAPPPPPPPPLVCDHAMALYRRIEVVQETPGGSGVGPSTTNQWLAGPAPVPWCADLMVLRSKGEG